MLKRLVRFDAFAIPRDLRLIDRRALRFIGILSVGLAAWAMIILTLSIMQPDRLAVAQDGAIPIAGTPQQNTFIADVAAAERRALQLQISALEKRLDAMEQYRVDARLSVLEKLSDDVSETRKIVYGAVLAILGQLVLTALQIRDQRARRAR